MLSKNLTFKLQKRKKIPNQMIKIFFKIPSKIKVCRWLTFKLNKFLENKKRINSEKNKNKFKAIFKYTLALVSFV